MPSIQVKSGLISLYHIKAKKKINKIICKSYSSFLTKLWHRNNNKEFIMQIQVKQYHIKGSVIRNTDISITYYLECASYVVVLMEK